MIHLEILLEEDSIKPVLDHILSELDPDENLLTRRFHVHHGKKKLLKMLPKLLKGYSNWILKPENEDYHILIIVDQDQDDCVELKNQILDYCREYNLLNRTKVRIPVTMIESWYFGDPNALELTFPKLKKLGIGTKAIYRDPESRLDPARDLDREMKKVGYEHGYHKLAHAIDIAKHMQIGVNTANSFKVTIQAIEYFISLI